MPITIGEAIRRKVKKDFRTGKAIAGLMGMKPGNLNKIYKKDSLPSEMIARFCLVLDYDFFVHVNPFFEADAEVETAADEHIRTSLAKLQKCRTDLHAVELEAEYLRKEVVVVRDHLAARMAQIQLLEKEVARLTPGSAPPEQS